MSKDFSLIADRLAKIMPLVSSDNPNESHAAVLRIQSLLMTIEADWHDFTAFVVESLKSTPSRRPSSRRQETPDTYWTINGRGHLTRCADGIFFTIFPNDFGAFKVYGAKKVGKTPKIVLECDGFPTVDEAKAWVDTNPHNIW